MKRLLSLNALLLVGLSAACTPASRPVDAPGRALTSTDTPTAVPNNMLTTTTAAIPGDSTDLGQLVASGLEVYRQQYCGICHRLDAASTGGLFGPTHNGMGTTADHRIREAEYAGTATTAEGYIRESIIDPAGYVVPGYEYSRYRMPAYTYLSEADLNALVQILLREK